MVIKDPLDVDTEQTKADVDRWVSNLDQAIAELRAEIARQYGEDPP